MTSMLKFNVNFYDFFLSLFFLFHLISTMNLDELRQFPGFLPGVSDKLRSDEVEIDYEFVVTLITPSNRIEQCIGNPHDKPFLRFYWDIQRCNEALFGDKALLLSEESECDLLALVCGQRDATYFNDVVTDERRKATPMDRICSTFRWIKEEEEGDKFARVMMMTFHVTRELPISTFHCTERPMFRFENCEIKYPDVNNWFGSDKKEREAKATEIVQRLKKRLNHPDHLPLVLRKRTTGDLVYHFSNEYREDLIEVLHEMLEEDEHRTGEMKEVDLEAHKIHREWIAKEREEHISKKRKIAV